MSRSGTALGPEKEWKKNWMVEIGKSKISKISSVLAVLVPVWV